MRKIIVALLSLLPVFCQAQQVSQPSNQSRVAGRFVAWNYGQWSDAISQAPGGTGSQIFSVQAAYITLPDGRKFVPFNTNSAIFVGSEQVTLTAVGTGCVVNNNQPGACFLTATFSQQHTTADLVRPATYGLQEALNDAGASGGGAVVLDSAWTALGGTTAIKNAATLPTNTGIEDARTGAPSGGGGGSTTFDQIGSGTNLGQGLVVGNGTVLTPTGTGFINANEVDGVPLASLTGLLYLSTGTPSTVTQNASLTTEILTQVSGQKPIFTSFPQLSLNYISPSTYGAKFDAQVSNNVVWVASNSTINMYQSVAIDTVHSVIGSGSVGTTTCAISGGGVINAATCSGYLDGAGGCHINIVTGGSYTVSGGAPTATCSSTTVGVPSVFVLNLVGPVFASTDFGGSTTKVIYAVGQIATQVRAGVVNMVQQSSSTVTYVNPNQITVTTAPTISCTSTVATDVCKLYWGTIDTAAYIQADQVAMNTQGSAILLPPGNSMIDGCINQFTFPHPNSPVNFGGSSTGQSSTIIGVANFKYTNAPNTGCLFYDQFTGAGTTISATGDYIHDVTFDGSSIGVFSGVPVGTSLIWLQQNNMTNAWVDAWGSGTTNLSGISMNGVSFLHNSGSNGGGFDDCVSLSNAVGGTNIIGTDAYCGQSSGAGLRVSGGTVQVFGGAQMNTTVINGSTAVLNSQQSIYQGITLTQGTLNSDQDSVVGAITIAAAGIASFSKCVTGQITLNGGHLSESNCINKNSGGFAGLEISTTAAPATFNDLGNNQYIGATSNLYYQGTGTTGGNFASPDMATGSCSGTATAATTVFLYGLGGSLAGAPVTTCTGTTQLGGQVMKHSGTLRTLWVNLGTAGVSPGAPFTVYKNGSATTLTCNPGTTTNCFDVTNAHEVNFAAGDVIAIGFTTNLADTLANVTAGVYANWK